MKKLFLFSCLLSMFALLLAAGAAPAADLYWISFNHHGTDDCHLMQIDLSGNVTKAPIVVFDDYHSHSTAMAPISASKIVYYANESNNHEIRRVIVDRQTLALSSDLILKPQESDTNFMQVTQGAAKFFMALENDSVLKGFDLTSKGKLAGTNFRLSPRTDGGNDEGGVSADGRMAFSIDFDGPDKLYLQPLRSNGLPVGSPQVVASSSNLDCADVSGVLPGNVRFALILDGDADSVTLQRVDATTGAKLGSPILISEVEPDHSDQAVAIDPLGRFAIFSDVAQPCNVSSLYYQALDAAGNPSGSRKELVGCAFQTEVGNNHSIQGYDLLKN